MTKRLHKHYFQLLEVMIALFLVALCAIPVMQTFVAIHTDYQRMYREIDMDHYAHLFHAKLIEDLYLRGANGENIEDWIDRDFSSREVKRSELSVTLDSSPYDATYKLTAVKPKTQNHEKTQKFLLKLTMNLFLKTNPDKKSIQTFEYLIFVKRFRKEGQTQPKNQQANQSGQVNGKKKTN